MITKHPFMMDKAIVRIIAKKLLPEKLVYKPKWGFGIYGHKNMKIQSEYFKRGFIADLLNMDDPIVEYIVETQDRYLVGKLVSLEVFGRIFERGETQESVTDRNLKYIQMVVGLIYPFFSTMKVFSNPSHYTSGNRYPLNTITKALWNHRTPQERRQIYGPG